MATSTVTTKAATTRSTADITFEALTHLRERIEALRQEVAELYAMQRGGTIAEQEVGACLGLLIKTRARIGKAHDTLAQMEFDTRDYASDSGDDDDDA